MKRHITAVIGLMLIVTTCTFPANPALADSDTVVLPTVTLFAPGSETYLVGVPSPPVEVDKGAVTYTFVTQYTGGGSGNGYVDWECEDHITAKGIFGNDLWDWDVLVKVRDYGSVMDIIAFVGDPTVYHPYWSYCCDGYTSAGDHSAEILASGIGFFEGCGGCGGKKKATIRFDMRSGGACTTSGDISDW